MKEAGARSIPFHTEDKHYSFVSLVSGHSYTFEVVIIIMTIIIIIMIIFLGCLSM